MPTKVVMVRRPTDVLRAVVSAVAVVLVGVATAQGEIELDSWMRIVEELPPWLVQLCVFVVVSCLLVTAYVALVAVVRARADRTFLRDYAVAVSVTVVASYLVSLLVVDPAVGAGVLDPSRSDLLDFPDVMVAVIAAAGVVAVPHVARPNRKLLWGVVFASVWCGAMTDPMALVPVVAGFSVGMAISSGWLALVGSPAGLPDLSAVRAALTRQGVAVGTTTVERTPLWGGASTCLAVREDGGGPLRVKVYGRDAVAADFWVRLYRRVTYLDAERSWSGRRIDLVEHEAAVTAFAHQLGVAVTSVVAVSDWQETDPFVAVEWSGDALGDLEAEAVTDELVAHLWSTITDLHEVGIVHGGLDAESLRVDDGTVRLANLDRGRFSTEKRLRDRDLANVLVILGVLIGSDRAVDTANETLGPDRLNDLAPYLEPAAIRVPLHEVQGGLKSLLSRLRDGIAERTGTPSPPPADLKRLTPRRLLAMALVVLAVVALATALAGIDFAAVAEEVADARWALVLLALVVGQLVLLPEALATTCLVPERLPFGPLVALQSTMRFLGLAVPGPAARVAANAAFLRKQGVVIARSLTLGVVDSAAGLLVELLILVIAVAVGGLSLALFGIEPIDVEWVLVTAVLVVVAAVLALVYRVVEPVRSRVLGAWTGVRDVLVVLRDSPSRTAALVATNLTVRLISASALWLVLRALDVSLDFLAVLVVIAASNLLSGLIPVPGNVGVAEAALTTFLVAAGVPEDTAFAAAVVYRVCTAYLPPIWGAAAQRWLVRHDYL